MFEKRDNSQIKFVTTVLNNGYLCNLSKTVFVKTYEF